MFSGSDGCGRIARRCFGIAFTGVLASAEARADLSDGLASVVLGGIVLEHVAPDLRVQLPLGAPGGLVLSWPLTWYLDDTWFGPTWEDETGFQRKKYEVAWIPLLEPQYALPDRSIRVLAGMRSLIGLHRPSDGGAALLLEAAGVAGVDDFGTRFGASFGTGGGLHVEGFALLFVYRVAPVTGQVRQDISIDVQIPLNWFGS